MTSAWSENDLQTTIDNSFNDYLKAVPAFKDADERLQALIKQVFHDAYLRGVNKGLERVLILLNDRFEKKENVANV